MTSGKVVVHGWAIYAHPLFLMQVEALVDRVEALKAKYPEGYVKKADTKRLAAIISLAFDKIPQDPTRPEYQQGNTLGNQHSHWFRAKFFQQYRLFFRYHTAQKIIVLAWVNDSSTKRAYGSKSDAYRVFQKMIKGGNPPDDWNALMESATTDSERLRRVMNKD